MVGGEKEVPETTRCIGNHLARTDPLARKRIDGDTEDLVAPLVTFRANDIDVALAGFRQVRRARQAEQVTVAAAHVCQVEIGLAIRFGRDVKFEDGAVARDYRKPQLAMWLHVAMGVGTFVVVMFLA